VGTNLIITDRPLGTSNSKRTVPFVVPNPLNLRLDFSDPLEIGIGNYPLVPFSDLLAGRRCGIHAEFVDYGPSVLPA
jgi:hypothetical protein